MTEETGKDLGMAKALDEMPKALSSDNADFLDQVIKTLKSGKPLKEKDREKLKSLYLRYFGDKEEDEVEEPAEDEKPADDDVDEDDFA